MQQRKRVMFWLVLSGLLYHPIRELLYVLIRNLELTDFTKILKFGPEIIPLAIVAWAIWAARPQLSSLRDRPRYITYALLLVGWSILSALWGDVSAWQSFRGLRLDFTGLIVLISLWLFPLNEKDGNRILKWSFFIFVGLLVFSTVEFFFNTPFRLWAGHTFHRHYLGNIPQLRSLTPGPNPYGSLLIIGSALGAALYYGRKRLLLLGLIGVTFGQTYSRSAWLGVGVMGMGILAYEFKKRKRLLAWPVVLGLSILLGAGIGLFRHSEDVGRAVTHGSSTEEHFEITGGALNLSPKTLAIGDGIGSAGPVTFGTSKLVISESWYIQLIQELGLPGLILYLGLLYEVVKQLLARGFRVFAWMTIGLALNAAFLHTWSADFTLSIVFWTVIAVCLTSMKSKSLSGAS